MDKILIIDDDLDFIQMLTIKFRLDGYECKLVDPV